MIFERNKEGHLFHNWLEANIMFCEIFELAKNEDDMEYIFEMIMDDLNGAYEEMLDELEKNNESEE